MAILRFHFPVLVQLQDNDPSSIPKNIAGTIDTNGIVRVKWERVSSPDLKGYRVFRCNSLREEFVEISDSVIREASFTETVTLQTLTRDVYYSVRSGDHVWNNSDFSRPEKLLRPDRIAPVAPLVKGIYHTDSTIALQWINSSSDDIATKQLVRTSTSVKVVLKKYAGAATASFYIDANVEPGNVYTYEIAIANSSHNTSTLTILPFNYSPRVRPALKNFIATPDLEKRTITLAWDLPSSPVDCIIIYKGKGTEAIRPYKTPNGTTTQYIDNQLYTVNPYTYRIKCILKDGAETRIAEVQVRL